MSTDQNVVVRARDFYAIYMASCSGLNYQGLPCPQWKDLTDSVRGHWRVVALRSLQLQASDPEVLQLGQEAKILPSSYVLNHLGDSTRVEMAVATWTNYSIDSTVALSSDEVKIIRENHERDTRRS